MGAIWNTQVNYAGANGVGPIPVDIANGRDFDNPGWQACGFELMRHESAVTDWNDGAEIERIHYDEIAALARSLTGCDHALVRGHILRNPEQIKIHQQLGPIMFAHSDFASTYGDRMRDYFVSDDPNAAESLEREGITGEDVRKAKRMLILQFWRNVGEPKMDLPLAFCDARSVPAEDVRAFPVNNYAGGGFNFDALAVIAPQDRTHDWYVHPEMTRDEVIAFRTYDSELDAAGKTFWTPHAAVRDPGVELGKPSRYSIELRATCLFA